jgi:plastocyanin
MRKFLNALAAASLVLGGVAPLAVSAATILPLSQVHDGDLIRGTTFPAVYYYGRDGFRYVFPNDKTYFTWYANFNTVKWVSDADLAKVQIGGNVTYKPGAKMIKINSDPKTYAVDAGGSLRWVTTEQIAIALYGSDWNKKIDDVADAFFGNYKKGADITQSGDFSSSAAVTNAVDIDHDKNLQLPTLLHIQDFQFSPNTITIQRGTAVKWVNDGTAKHTATADDDSWGTGTLNPGENFTRYFKTAGTFTYHCSYHPDMTGTIIVQ